MQKQNQLSAMHSQAQHSTITIPFFFYKKKIQSLPNLQSPDEIDLPPLDPELLDHQRRRQVFN